MSEYYKNRHGIAIKKCCASCQHNGGTKGADNSRICTNHQGVKRPSDVCPEWELRHVSDPPERGEIIYENAGLSGGRVKAFSYLKFLHDYEQPRDKREHVPVKQIREEYQQQYGDIFVKM